MKIIKLVVPAKSVDEMNNLVDSVCRIVGQDATTLRDKFKMVDIASPKKIMDLCEHLNLNLEFRNKNKENEIAVSLEVPNKFSFDDLDKNEDEIIKEKEEIKEAPVETVKEEEEVVVNTEDVPEENVDNFKSVSIEDETLNSTDTGDDDFPF